MQAGAAMPGGVRRAIPRRLEGLGNGSWELPGKQRTVHITSRYRFSVALEGLRACGRGRLPIATNVLEARTGTDPACSAFPTADHSSGTGATFV